MLWNSPHSPMRVLVIDKPPFDFVGINGAYSCCDADERLPGDPIKMGAYVVLPGSSEGGFCCLHASRYYSARFI